MNDQTDSQLLRAYAEHHAEPAFAELVRRHVDFVYSAALRMVCDSHLAEDVTQGVFVALAKQAVQLANRPVLSGWLHGTARNIAAQTVRTDVRRRAREQEAVAMNELIAGESEAGWEQIAPQLDAALGELGESDRDALLLRYFERKSAQEMALTLGISDEAAQKRVSRAVEKLRELFSKRKITIGTSGLVVLILANAVQSAPIGLAVTISAAAVLTGTAVSTSTVITATKAIAMTTLQKTIITAALVAAVGTGIFEAHQAAQLRNQVQILQQQQAPLSEQIRQLQSERDDATNQLTSLLAENQQLKSNPNQNELLRLRGEIGALKNKNEDENLRLRQKISQLEGMWINWTNGAHFANPFFGRDEWSERGMDEPINALQTMLWAIKQNDNAKLAQLVSRTNNSQLIESLILPKRIWDRVTGVQVVDISVVSNGNTQRKAIIGTILEAEIGSSGASPGTSSDNPVLDKYIHTESIMHRWFLIESNGQWYITGGG